MRHSYLTFFAACLFLLTPALFYAQANGVNQSSSIEPLASKSLLLDISTIAQSRLVAVGQHGNILTSDDAISWQQANVPTQSTLTGVFFINNNQGWAVGHDATILHTNDGGLTWQLQQSLPQKEKPLFDVVFKDALHGIAVGAYGLFYRTVDGGKSWHNEFHSEFLNADDAQYIAELKAEDEAAYQDEIGSILPHFNRVIKADNMLYLVGEIGLLASSSDFGRHWQMANEIYQGSFFDLLLTPEHSLLAVGLRGHIFRGNAAMEDWQQVNSKTSALLNSALLTDDNRIIVLGNNGVLLTSKDDGKSYQVQTQKDGKALIAGVWFNHQLVAVSDVGIKIIKVK